MALTISEANAVTKLVRYILNDGTGAQTADDVVLAALQLLTEKTYKTLLAGPIPGQIGPLWAQHVERRDNTISLEIPDELGLAWDDGEDLLALTDDGIELTLRGIDSWELDPAGAREMAAHLAAMAQAREQAAGGAS